MTWSIRAAAGSAVGSAAGPAGGCAATEVEVVVAEFVAAEFVAASPWGRFASVFDDDAGDGLVSEEVLLRRLADAEGLMAQLAAPKSNDPHVP